jgi:hypothetical protein
MIIIGIDVGLVNLALCSFNNVTKKIEHCDKVSLLQPKGKNVRYKYCESNIPHLVNEFICDHRTVFEKADMVVIEYQMKRNMLMIMNSICSFLLAFNIKARFVQPRDVRKFFNISTNNYAKNKQASIKFLPKLLTKNQLKDVNLSRFGSKKDDVCEAVIIAFYASKNINLFDKVVMIEAAGTTLSRKKRKLSSSSSRTSSKKSKKK